MTSIQFPRPTEPFLVRSGLVTGWWYDYLRTLTPSDLAAELQAQIADLIERVGELENESDLLAQFNGIASVRVTGSLASGVVNITLVGDDDAPGASYYYGTDASGEKGWYERLLSTLADVDVTTPPVAGDALVYDGTAWVPGIAAQPQIFSRITAAGDVRITADGDIRITD